MRYCGCRLPIDRTVRDDKTCGMLWAETILPHGILASFYEYRLKYLNRRYPHKKKSVFSEIPVGTEGKISGESVQERIKETTDEYRISGSR